MGERAYSRRLVLQGALGFGAGAALNLLPDFIKADSFDLEEAKRILGANEFMNPQAYESHLLEEDQFQSEVTRWAQSQNSALLIPGSEPLVTAQSVGNMPYKLHLASLANGGYGSGGREFGAFVPNITDEGLPVPKLPETKNPQRPKWSRETLLQTAYKVPTSEPIVCLTIDDGYFRRREIADIIAAENVTATIFMIGQVMENFPDDVRYLDATGLVEWANHTYTHTDLRSKTWEQIKYEFLTSQYILQSTLNGKTTEPFGRSYGGNHNSFTDSAMADLDFREMLWNVSGDAGDYTPGQLVDLYLGQIDRMADPRGAIILMHFRIASCDALPYIIRGLKQRGLRPVSLSSAYALSSAA